MDGLTQEQAAIKAGVPENALSRGKGMEILARRTREVAMQRSIKQDEGDHPRVQRKELDEHYTSEELRRGEEMG